MQLAIATNPHTKSPRKLWDTLDQKDRENEGKGYLDADFDKQGFEAFKQTLKSTGSKIVVKG
jgi:hypothetical protein